MYQERQFGDDTMVYIVIAIVALVLFVMLRTYLANTVIPFFNRRRYLKMEIARADDDDEYYYWKDKLKRHYIRHIPLIGRFLVRFFY